MVGRSAGGTATSSFDDRTWPRGGRPKPDPRRFSWPGLSERVILDEVQRTPELFSALKMEIDRRRESGRFLLTGSAQVLLVPRLSDSLAGRMEILRLHPLAQCELERRRTGFLDRLFAGEFATVATERMGSGIGGARRRGRLPGRPGPPLPSAVGQPGIGITLKRKSSATCWIWRALVPWTCCPRLLAAAAHADRHAVQSERPGFAFSTQPPHHRRLRRAVGKGLYAGAAPALAQQSADAAGQDAETAHGRYRSSLRPARH